MKGTVVKGRLVRAGVVVAERFTIELDDEESEKALEEHPEEVVRQLLNEAGIKINSLVVASRDKNIPISGRDGGTGPKKPRPVPMHVVYPPEEQSNTIVI